MANGTGEGQWKQEEEEGEGGEGAEEEEERGEEEQGEEEGEGEEGGEEERGEEGEEEGEGEEERAQDRTGGFSVFGDCWLLRRERNSKRLVNSAEQRNAVETTDASNRRKEISRFGQETPTTEPDANRHKQSREKLWILHFTTQDRPQARTLLKGA
ncbi:hypothetical protein TGVAND_438220 [Toxoplasma gondii VAND]|uniref:Uncharacterized protein n=1 Tax=Toxoplasma gondii VAND TaxID=933077 RepID=A0A086PJV1_TOXGO|nr:hypothetical protein TGVAND_438220 [Toxoplasma gondii VAND]